MSMYSPLSVDVLLGKTLTSITKSGNDALLFCTSTGEKYTMTHIQVCCESVVLDEVWGDLDDLVGEPLLLAEEVSSTLKALMDPGPKYEYTESYTWTFYKFATRKGYVDLRWYGTSNGYYSECVSFYET